MKWIEGQDIKDWAKRYDAKGNLPRFIGRLIRATTPNDTFLEFPGGSDVFVGGWDGQVNCSKATAYVPQGVSLWELGTETKNKSKAENDYQKRTIDPLGYNPAESTFVFVTPNYWRDKDKWRNEKLKENIWKDIKVFDSRNLEEWFNQAAAVARDFAIHTGKYPPDGIQTAEDFWKEWSIGPKGQLPASIVTRGRENELEQLKKFLTNQTAGIKAVKASSKEEAIAFIIACAKQFEIQYQENFFAKSLIIDSINNFRSISNNQNALILISRIEETSALYRGVGDGHHVLLPMGADDTFNSSDIIVLPKLDRDGTVDSLKQYGLGDDDAEKYAKESGRNLTILKRLLRFPQNKAEWAKAENAREVIPALLMGRWDESKKGDKEALSIVAGEDYDSYIAKLSKWKTTEIPFIYQIGSTWRLASPLDAWSNLSIFLAQNDLQKFENRFLEVLKNIRPAFELEPEKRQMASFYGKESDYSEWVREGLTQSLILVGIYGAGLKLPINGTSQLWVDSIIHKLLYNAESKLWASLNYVMPLIAEASPDRFLYAVESSLSKQKPEIMGMFEEEPSLIIPRSFHTGLLWALEGLAWIPEYLSRVTLVLARLSVLDPGGTLSNRPMSSLRSIFLPWMPQSYAESEKRHDALLLLMKNEPNIAWQLFLSILPKHHDVGQPTHKTRWRLFNESAEKKNFSYEELRSIHSQIVDDLLSLTAYEEHRISQLIETTDALSFRDKNKILAFVKNNLTKIVKKDFSIWHQVRKILHHHRSNPEADWSMTETELQDYQYLFDKLYPDDTIEKYKWMFDDHWPKFSEGYNYNEINNDEQENKINEKRKIGLIEIWQEFGTTKIEELSAQIKEKSIYGDIAAYVLNEKEDIIQFLSEKRLLDKEEIYTVRGFVHKKEILNGWDWVKEFFEKLKLRRYSNKALASFLIPLSQNKNLWDYVSSTNDEIELEYWLDIRPYLYNLSLSEKVFAIQRLLTVGRGLTAIHECYRFVSELENNLIVEILQAGVASKEPTRIPSHEVEAIFENIYRRSDFERNKLAQLEWIYLPILTTGYKKKGSLILYEELSSNPIFFVDVLKWVYKPKNDRFTIEESNEIDEDTKMKRAEQAYRLLSSWNKIPGVDENFRVDVVVLNDWIKRARELAATVDRLDPADIEIGKILAQYPEANEKQWPPDEICEIIDTINSDALNRNFGVATFNKRSFSSKRLYEGGGRESGLAKYFTDLYIQINSKWPITASILNNLARGYELDAKREDERAERDSLEY